MKKPVAGLGLALISAAAHAASAQGSSTVTLDIVSMGPDIQESLYIPGVNGVGSSAHSSGTGTNTFGATTNSIDTVNAFGSSTASGIGWASEEYLYGIQMDLYNSGTTVEDVTLDFSDTVLAQSSIAPGQKAWGVGIASLVDNNTVVWEDVAQSTGNQGPADGANSFQYVAHVQPGATDTINGATIAESYAYSGAPGPASIAPFALGLIGLAKRRIKARTC